MIQLLTAFLQARGGATLAILDVEKMLQPVSSDEPCGPDLEYDPVFAEMEKAAQGTPEQQYGETVIEAVPPEWSEVKRTALDLLARTKDLRVLAHLARATLNLDGLAGFRDALAVLRRYVVQHWAGLHPRLDPDDDNDPTIRNNAIGSLSDNGTTIQMLRNVPLVRSRAFGQISRRQIAWARREVPSPDGQEPLALDKIEGAFQDCDVEALAQQSAAVAASLEHLRGIDVAIGDEIGHGNGPNLENLRKELDGIRKVYAEQLAKRGYDPHAASDEPTPVEPILAEPVVPATSHVSPGVNSSPARTSSPRFAGDFTCREEAIRAIDAICVWFEKYEPSSPLPLLLRRAKRLSTKSFLEILRDISPGGVGEAEALGGNNANAALQMQNGSGSDHEESSVPPAASKSRSRDPDAY